MFIIHFCLQYTEYIPNTNLFETTGKECCDIFISKMSIPNLSLSSCFTISYFLVKSEPKLLINLLLIKQQRVFTKCIFKIGILSYKIVINVRWANIEICGILKQCPYNVHFANCTSA